MLSHPILTIGVTLGLIIGFAVAMFNTPRPDPWLLVDAYVLVGLTLGGLAFRKGRS